MELFWALGKQIILSVAELDRELCHPYHTVAVELLISFSICESDTQNFCFFPLSLFKKIGASPCVLKDFNVSVKWEKFRSKNALCLWTLFTKCVSD